MPVVTDMLRLTCKEFDRNLAGLNDDDARKRIEPMNCISWIIAHVANQHHTFFVAWQQEKAAETRFLPYGYGSPASQSHLEEALSLWHDATGDTEVWLKSVTNEKLKELPATSSPESENNGALMVPVSYTHLTLPTN